MAVLRASTVVSSIGSDDTDSGVPEAVQSKSIPRTATRCSCTR